LKKKHIRHKMASKKELLDDLKKDLSVFHSDYMELIEKERNAHDPDFLKRVAEHIKKLDHHAKMALDVDDLKERGELLHFALTTPWGAPFVGETTLLDAANTYTENTSDSSLGHLLSSFSKYGHEKQAPLLKVFDEIFDELESD